ncbi:MAG TPA: HAD-IIIC family phosphatase [Sedimentisphaerales bacterium]|nr:HAD-IIIC family phosphatase [Sedimentisphaerales bacterium]HRS10710.1 HAD-IIIC family phosphatase [Sedimentisphaerales bacterium]HRV47415.1 HAD-IIIC family phosphatase [Sedimentisphaerales bacterium]
MKPFLCFLGGCEFTYLIKQLKSHPEAYFDFDYFSCFEDCGEFSAYGFLAAHTQKVFDLHPSVVILSQRDGLGRQISDIHANRVVSRAEQDEQIAELARQCELMILTLSALNVPIVMQYFPWARTNLRNRFKPPADIYNEEQILRRYCEAMEALAVRYPQFYFLNLTQVCAMDGFRRTLKMTDRATSTHIAFPPVGIAQEYADLIHYLLHPEDKVKCVLVDLDNTMWHGVIRDVGVENIEIRPLVERFRWNVLTILHTRGLLIGVISKNDPHLETEIMKFLGPHARMLLPAACRINWLDKWQNMIEIQRQLNIGMDAIAFIDDNPFEREQMKTMLPEVRVYDENIFERLLSAPQFQPEVVTRESRNRSAYYRQDEQRQAAQATMTRESFLSQCRFTIGIHTMQPYEVDRVSELVQRTNQLNTSIRRYTKAQIIALGRDPDCDILTVHVSDKFGDYGLVGVCIGFRRGSAYEIDTLLFSCRIMSKGVEDYTLTHVLRSAQSSDCSQVLLHFRKGPKNKPMRMILEKNGFSRSEEQDETVTYAFDLHRQSIQPFPQWFATADDETQVPVSIPA